jgi:hypothetical protein
MVSQEDLATVESNARRLRWEFVGMLFALTVAKIAENAAPLLVTTWKIDPVQVTRVLLVGFVVASSWIGWSVSKAKGAQQPVDRVFSLRFAILIIDVVLVVLYFKMAEGIGRSLDEATTFLPEALWSTAIFAVYLVWDLVTKSLRKGQEDRFKRSIITGVCVASALIILFTTKGFAANQDDVVITNIALLLVFVAFRAAKDQPPQRLYVTYGLLLLAIPLAATVRL